MNAITQFTIVFVLYAMVVVVIMCRFDSAKFEVRPTRGTVVDDGKRWAIYWELHLANGHSCVMKDAVSYESEEHAKESLPYVQNTPIQVVEAECPELRCMTPQDWDMCYDYKTSRDHNTVMVILYMLVIWKVVDTAAKMGEQRVAVAAAAPTEQTPLYGSV